MKTKQYFVYILTNQKNTTLYPGVTNDLVRRIYLHKQKVVKGFTHKYNLTKLIYYENHNNVLEAIKREKKLKKWGRSWKDQLIGNLNPDWADLFPQIRK